MDLASIEAEPTEVRDGVDRETVKTVQAMAGKY